MTKIIRYSNRLTCESCEYAEYGTLPQRVTARPEFARCTGFCRLTKEEDGQIDFLITTGMELCRFKENELIKAKAEFDQRKIKKDE